MNNKRFVLTVDEEKKVNLWKLDELTMLQEYPGQEFNAVKQKLQELDMKSS